jgi:photosystem II stability/assembly factor-like uncharacterized protein
MPICSRGQVRFVLLTVASLICWHPVPVGSTGTLAEKGGEQHGLQPPTFGVSEHPSIQALALTGERTLYAGSFGKGVFRSDDRGGTWIAVNEGMTDLFVLSLASLPDGTVYAGTLRGGVFERRSDGSTWHAVNTGLKRLEIKALLVHGGVIYAGTGDGLYRRALRGDQWSVVTNGLDETLVHSIAVGEDRTLYVGTSGRGIFRYGNRPHESGWTRLRQGLVDHEGLVENFIRVVAIDKDNALYAGTFDGGVFLSNDKGKSWRPISRALPNDSIRGIVTGTKGLFVATGRGVFRTLDHGRQWMPINHGLTELSVQVLVASADGALYAGTSAGVFRSDDDGKNWAAISQGMEAGDAGH